MFRNTIIATLTVALIAGSTIVAPTTASAANGRTVLGVAAALVAGAVVATAAANARQDHGYRTGGYNDDCFEKKITRFDRYTGEHVVAYKTICR
ncbi:hypothetical protein JQ629_05385 [Bradyrhizobium sp. AUGA SZCCT0222]|uniref:hypothetical protein n=1 Tax=Bradyrhizobium sp. AUGA SZCCT0222 TaxID=2807668 RepID=UPI001BAB2D03|nr:hypothetical protein [Bradyrhizobium sp. AUGA SZCCT0222]MBR1266939.1 hypothetical protein [Bradyrhizobium sp. AUGA SZCCT0222]